MVRIFPNTQSLIDFIKTLPLEKTNMTDPLESAVWFCCCSEAQMFSEMSIKELASLFLDGVKAYKLHPVESVDSFLETHLEDFYHNYDDWKDLITTTDEGQFIPQEIANQCGVDNVTDMILHHFNIEHDEEE